MHTLLNKFCIQKHISLRINNLIKCTQNEFLRERKYWKKFHRQLTSYMYKECNHFDNYVGNNMKLLRAFFNYLRIEKGIDTKDIPKLFYVAKEEIPIIVLSTEQLNFLINNIEFEGSLSYRLQKIKDIFVFGCTVGLRISDLLALNQTNLEKNFNDYYIKLFSKKTSAFTRIKLPDYVIKIIEKYEGRFPTLLPKVHLFNFNKYIREIIEKAGWTYWVDKKRTKQGVSKVIKKTNTKDRFRFCDLITSHTMRKTAITTYLTLGMPEQLVRRISGHSPGSKEFFRYVKYSEEILDKEITRIHLKFAPEK
jgi:integrase